MDLVYHPVFNPRPIKAVPFILKSSLSPGDKLTALLEVKLRQSDEVDFELIDAIYSLCLNPSAHQSLRKEGALEAFKFYSDFALTNQTTIHKKQIETLISELKDESNLEQVKQNLITLFLLPE